MRSSGETQARQAGRGVPIARCQKSRRDDTRHGGESVAPGAVDAIPPHPTGRFVAILPRPIVQYASTH